MNRGKRFTSGQIIKILREVDVYSCQGKTIAQVSCAYAITEQTYYRWRKEYGGLHIDQARRFKDLIKTGPLPLDWNEQRKYLGF